MARTLLLVGARLEAVKAARRLGLACGVVAESGATTRALRRLASGVGVAPPDAPVEVLEAAARAAIGSATPDAIVAATERGVVPAAVLRQRFGLPGLSVESARAVREKPLMKARFQAAGLPCVPTLPVASEEEARRLARDLGRPVVVKALASSGSRGTVVATDDAVLASAVHALLASPLSGGAGLERFVDGRELSVELFVDRGRVAFTNLTEYVLPGRANLLPAPLEPPLKDDVEDLARRAAAACGLERGIGHLEIYLTQSGPIVGELAARAPGGRLMELMSRVYGFDAWAESLRLELGDDGFVPPPVAQRACGNLFFHPGAGTVASVRGWTAARTLPGVALATLSLRPGQVVPPREGTGQTVGQLVVEGERADAVRETLLTAHRLVRIAMRP